MSYVVVMDVAASWEQYGRFADTFAGPAPAGLVVHAAGPTDEGFRIVAVWESEEAWGHFIERLDRGGKSPKPHQAVRGLHPAHMVYGRTEALGEPDDDGAIVDRGAPAVVRERQTDGNWADETFDANRPTSAGTDSKEPTHDA